MRASTIGLTILLVCCAVAACGSDDAPSDPAASGGTGASATGGTTSGGGTTATGGTVATGGSTSGGTAGAGGSDGGLDASDAAPSDAADAATVVGSPELFTQSVLEMDFSQGQNGKYRANGGAWQDFASWSQPGVGGGWTNTGVKIQTTDAVRTAVVDNALGPGRVLRTWIEAGDTWKSTATYPRTELTSSTTSNVPFKSEWRLEMPFYVSGDVPGTGASIIGFQFHHNGSTGSPPFALGLSDGTLRFSIKNSLADPNVHTNIFPIKANTIIDIVVELKFGYVSDGAYVRLWANGTKYVDITDKNVGYPDTETTAGYWKFCSLYDWANLVKGSRSVFTPTFRLLKKP